VFHLFNSPLRAAAHILFFMCALIVCNWQLAVGATFGASDSTPLTEKQIGQIGGANSEGIIFSGDVIYYSDALEKSGLIAQLWPDGKLIYEFDASLTADQRGKFVQACGAWTVNTSVSCVARNGETNFVRVASHNGERCSGAYTSCSAVGMRGGNNAQDLFVYTKHWDYSDVLQHEIGHAFGLIHEQQRPDRDTFVSILTQNIVSGSELQFSIRDVSVVTEYDFDSIMHYNNCVFSNKSCKIDAPTEGVSTIFPKACNRDIVGGKVITRLDLEGVGRAYAPQVFNLYSKSRRSQCGVHNLSPAQVSFICGSSVCAQAGPVSYDRVDEFHHEECFGGFLTDPDDFNKCPSLKTLIYSHSNTADLACGLGDTRTKYYWDWSCACGKQSLNKLCVDVEGGVDVTALEKLRSSTDPRDVSTVRYIDQISGWRKLGFVEESIAGVTGGLLVKNYLQKSYPDRLLSLVFKMRLMIELNLYVKKSYTLRYATFLKLLREEGMNLGSM